MWTFTKALAILFAIHLGQGTAIAAPSEILATTSQNAETIACYDRFELSFQLTRDYDNPTDTAEVSVTAVCITPDGQSVNIPAFFYREYAKIDGRYVGGGGACWKIRFAPSQLGPHRITSIAVVDTSGNQAIATDIAFQCVAGPRKGPIGVDPRDSGYFSHADGQPYLAIGHNVCWLSGGLDTWEAYFKAMDAAGENWTRIWMTHLRESYTLLEWSRHEDPDYFGGVGRLSMPVAWKLDRIIHLAEKYGIAIQLVFQHHGQFSSQTNPEWRGNPYNIANAKSDGGFLERPDDFFTNAEARRLTRNKYRYIVARWGYSDAILCWELWNEVYWTDGWVNDRSHENVIRWHDEMARHIRDVDPHHHMITTSSDKPGYTPIWQSDMIDMVQLHFYGGGRDTVASFVEKATSLARHGKPVVIGEFGIGKTGDVLRPETTRHRVSEPYRTHLQEALNLHNAIWAAFHLKSSAHLWWWDRYIDELELYREFVALAKYADGEDPAAHGLASAVVEIEGPDYLRCVGLSGKRHAYLWFQDEGSQYGKTAHGTISEAAATLSGLEDGRYRIEFHATRGTGGLLDEQEATSVNGVLRIELPTFSKDIAVKIKRKDM